MTFNTLTNRLFYKKFLGNRLSIEIQNKNKLRIINIYLICFGFVICALLLICLDYFASN